MPARPRHGVADVVAAILGKDLPFGVAAYDGSRVGPHDPPATVVIRSPDALARILTRPGELGLSRAYVAGDLDVEGDIFAVLGLPVTPSDLRPNPVRVAELLRSAGPSVVRFLPPPAEESRPRGALHTKSRDRRAISHHYDVSNTFYELVLGPSMTYSCAVFERPDDSLETAQAAKHELVCTKLGLEPGMRLLDVGCGWGSMAIHAATHHGVRVVGVTLSRAQFDWAAKRVADARAGRPGRDPAAGLPGRRPTARSTPSARSACSSTSAGAAWPGTSNSWPAWCGRAADC